MAGASTITLYLTFALERAQSRCHHYIIFPLTLTLEVHGQMTESQRRIDPEFSNGVHVLAESCLLLPLPLRRSLRLSPCYTFWPSSFVVLILYAVFAGVVRVWRGQLHRVGSLAGGLRCRCWSPVFLRFNNYHFCRLYGYRGGHFHRVGSLTARWTGDIFASALKGICCRSILVNVDSRVCSVSCRFMRMFSV